MNKILDEFVSPGSVFSSWVIDLCVSYCSVIKIWTSSCRLDLCFGCGLNRVASSCVIDLCV